MTQTVTLTVNGTARAVTVGPRTLLVHTLRDELHLTGTHVGPAGLGEQAMRQWFIYRREGRAPERRPVTVSLNDC